MATKLTNFEGCDGVQNSVDDILNFNSAIAKTPLNQTADISSDNSVDKKSECNDMQVYADNILQELEMINPSSENMIPIFTCEGAQLFFCDQNGKSESTYEKHKLIISKVEGCLAETVFLTVGDWVYPLFPGVSPCFRSEERLFVFPDIHSQSENATVMVLLPEEECNALHLVLTSLLSNYEESRQRRSVETDSASSYEATSKSSYIARSLIKGSSALAGRMDTFASKAMTKIEPKPQANIDPSVQQYTHTAANVVGKTAQASGFIASKFGQAVTALGRYVSPYVSNKVKEYVPENVSQAAGNYFHGFGEIYSGLEESVGILANSVANNTVKLVEHRHGVQAGQISNDVLSIVGNMYAIRRDLSLVRPKSLAKGMIKSTGRAIAEDWRNVRRASQDMKPEKFHLPIS